MRHVIDRTSPYFDCDCCDGPARWCRYCDRSVCVSCDLHTGVCAARPAAVAKVAKAAKVALAAKAPKAAKVPPRSVAPRSPAAAPAATGKRRRDERG